MIGSRLKTIDCFVMRLGVCWAVAIAFSLIGSVQAWALGLGSLPMTYSGRLAESSGAPKDGPVDIVATFWTSEFEGTQLGQSFSFASTVLNQGVFSLQFPFLASQVQDIFRDGAEPVFIEITSGGQTYPRQKFNFIPLAMRVPVDNRSLSFDSASGKLGIAGAKTAATGSMLVSNGTGGVSWVAANTSGSGGGSGGGGTVTSVATGVGLTGGPITNAGTISLATTGVTAGSYTRPNVTVDAQGRITGAQSGGLLVDSDIAAGAGIAQSKIQGLVADLGSKVASVAAGAGIAVTSNNGTATVSLGGVGTAGTYTLVQTNAQGQVVSGSTLSASDIPALPASKITSGQLPTANGGTGVTSTATFPTTGVVATRDAAETLTNKTLNGSVINGASSISGTTTINTTGAATTGALIAATVTSAGDLTVRGDGTNANKLVLNDKTNNKYVAFKAPDVLGASFTWELPESDGSPGQVLATNGSGTLSWVSGLAPTGAASGDLTGNFPSPALAAVGTAGNYTKVTTDSKGRVVSGTTLTPNDLPPISATSLNTGLLAVAYGGTGVGAFTNNGVVIGSSSALSSTAAGMQYNVLTVDASNQPTFGTLNLASSNAVNGTLGLANGGTGATTKSAAFDALSPMTNEGDLIIGGASGTGARLAGNTTATKHFLSSAGTGSAATAPVWVALTASDLPGHSASLITSGTLDVARGGTGASTTGSNLVFAGPTSGSGAPSFRALVAGDYPEMVGANGTAAGAKGAVPAPAATDNGKFLRGDGTWSTPDASAAGASNQIQYNSSGVLGSNTNFVYSAGNVGIGTMSPAATLDINGQIKIQGGTPGAGKVLTSDANGFASWSTAAVGSITGVTAGTGLTGGGTSGSVTLNADVGTTANKLVQLDPSAKLPAVDGSALTNLNPANLSSAVSVAKGGSGLTSGTSGGILYYSAASTMASSTALTANGVVLGGGAGAGPTATAAGAANSVLRVSSGGGAPSFGAIDVSQSNAVTGTLNLGNGGTGTSLLLTGGTGQYLKQTTSGAAVSVGTIAAADLPIMVGDSGSGGAKGAVPAPASGDSAGGKFLKADGSWSVPSSSTNWTAPGSIGSTTPNSGAFTTLTSSGNVGIGTTAPTSRLQLAGETAQFPQAFSISPTAHATSRRASLNLGNWQLAQDLLGDGTLNFGLWDGTAGGWRMTVNTSGNVGIGTTAPANNLHLIATSSSTAGLKIESSTNDSTLSLKNTSAGGREWWLGSGGNGAGGGPNFYIYDYTNNGVRMAINSAGNVGIGTTNPSKPLEVAGTIKSTSGGFAFPDGSTQTTAATSGGITFSGSTSAMDVTVSVSVASNSLLSTTPTTSVITAPYSGNYLLTGMTGVCSGSFGGTYAVSMKVNGAWVAYAQNSTNCETASFSVFSVISAGDTIAGICGNNIGYTASCTWSIVKL